MALHKLKIGLEIHTQLKSCHKLFSLSKNTTSILEAQPNSSASFFDLSLPGTQPKLNKEPLLLALKTAIALNCKISPVSSFDRKHYFYGDQPLGYQITQHYRPVARDGFVKLSPRYDNIPADKTIRIEQLQIEQDTGRSLYRLEGTSNIDFNRSNIPLIEMVTKPDFETVDEVRSFIKKFQQMLVNLDVCTGELETGAIRVDVNLSVDDHSRIEIKNLPTTSAIATAIRHEFQRQCKLIDNGGSITEVETRGWNGKSTYKLRSKENAIDYRYMPDPELPLIKLDLEEMLPKLKASLPPTVEERLEKLMSEFGLKLRDANLLLANSELLQYYEELVFECQSKNLGNPINWVTHEMLGCLTKSNLHFTKDVLPVLKFAELLEHTENGKITKNNAKLLLMHLINNKEDQQRPIGELIDDFDLGVDERPAEQLDELVDKVLKENEKVVNEILKKGKVKKVNFLIGQCMRVSEGKIEPKLLEDKIKEKLSL